MLKNRTLASLFALVLTTTAAQAATVTQTFGVQTAFANGPGALSFALTGLDPNVNSAINLDFSFSGDLNAGSENFDLAIDGTSFGTGCDNNAANGNFGNSGGGFFGTVDDFCSQSDNTVISTNLVIDAVTAAGLLADGVLNLVFSYSNNVNNNFVDITNAITSSGVVFNAVDNFNFAAGGTVTYETVDPSPVPLPGGLGLLLTALGGMAFARRNRGG